MADVTYIRFDTNGPIRMGTGFSPDLSTQYIPGVHDVGGIPNSPAIQVYNRGGTHVVQSPINSSIPETISVGNPVSWSQYYQTSNWFDGGYPGEPQPPIFPVMPYPEFQYPEYPPFDFEQYYDPDTGESDYGAYNRAVVPEFEAPGTPNADVGDMYEIIGGASTINASGTVTYESVTIGGQAAQFTQDETTGSVSVLVEREHPIVNNFVDITVETSIELTPGQYDPSFQIGEVAGTSRTFEAAYARNPVDAGSDQSSEQQTVFGGQAFSVEGILNLPLNYEIFLLENPEAETKYGLEIVSEQTVVSEEGKTTFTVVVTMPNDLPLDTAFRLYIQNLDSPYDFDVVTAAGSNEPQTYSRTVTIGDPKSRGGAPTLSWLRGDPAQERLNFLISHDFELSPFVGVPTAPFDVVSLGGTTADIVGDTIGGVYAPTIDGGVVDSRRFGETETILRTASEASFTNPEVADITANSFSADSTYSELLLNYDTFQSRTEVTTGSRSSEPFTVHATGSDRAFSITENYIDTLNEERIILRRNDTFDDNFITTNFARRPFIIEEGDTTYVIAYNGTTSEEPLHAYTGGNFNLLELESSEYTALTPNPDQDTSSTSSSFIDVMTIPDDLRPDANNYFVAQLISPSGQIAELPIISVDEGSGRINFDTRAISTTNARWIRRGIDEAGDSSYIGLNWKKVFTRHAGTDTGNDHKLVGITNQGNLGLIFSEGDTGGETFSVLDVTAETYIDDIGSNSVFRFGSGIPGRPYWTSDSVFLSIPNSGYSALTSGNINEVLFDGTSWSVSRKFDVNRSGSLEYQNYVVLSGGEIIALYGIGNLTSNIDAVNDLVYVNSDGTINDQSETLRMNLLTTLEAIAGNWDVGRTSGAFNISRIGFSPSSDGVDIIAFADGGLTTDSIDEGYSLGYFALRVLNVSTGSGAISPTTFTLERDADATKGFQEIDYDITFAAPDPDTPTPIATIASTLATEVIAEWNDKSDEEATLISTTTDPDTGDVTVSIATGIQEASGSTVTAGTGAGGPAEGSIAFSTIASEFTVLDRIALGSASPSDAIGFGAGGNVGFIGARQYDFTSGEFPETQTTIELDQAFDTKLTNVPSSLSYFYTAGTEYIGSDGSNSYLLTSPAVSNAQNRVYADGGNTSTYYDGDTGMFGTAPLSIAPTHIVYMGTVGSLDWYGMLSGSVYYVSYDGTTAEVSPADSSELAVGSKLRGGTGSTFRDLVLYDGSTISYLNMSAYDGANMPFQAGETISNPWKEGYTSTGIGDVVYDSSSSAWYWNVGSGKGTAGDLGVVPAAADASTAIAGTRNFVAFNYALNPNGLDADLEAPLDDASDAVISNVGTDHKGHLVVSAQTYINEVSVS